MGLDKSGNIQYRSFTSKCQKCKLFIKDYKCWYYNYIPFMIFENCVGYECDKFKSAIANQNNSHHVFRDYMDRKLFPEKIFGGKHRFNKKGERI